MIFFCFTDHGPGSAVGTTVLEAVERDAGLEEAREVLRTHPGASSAHIFDGDQFIGSVDAPVFGFTGVNNALPAAVEAADTPPAAQAVTQAAPPPFEASAPLTAPVRGSRKTRSSASAATTAP